jgi:hypothetical protein
LFLLHFYRWYFCTSVANDAAADALLLRFLHFCRYFCLIFSFFCFIPAGYSTALMPMFFMHFSLYFCSIFADDFDAFLL